MSLYSTRRQMIAMMGAALWAGAVRANPTEPVATRTMEGRAFASHWRITAPAHVDLERHRANIDALLSRIDAQMSPWRDDSEITGFNLTQRESAVSPDTALVARAALDIARDSGGWFDPTVGPLVAQWGFGRISGSQAGRWEGLAVNGDSLRKDDAGLTMDLCGIAKGRALDLLADYLRDAGETAFLVDLGGELKSEGLHPEGRPWQIAVEDPRPSHNGPAFGLRLPDGMAVATSGLRTQSYELDGQRYGHIIDPHHARPSDGSAASVSVLDAEGMVADGWATALAAAGEQGPQIARSNGISALFLFNTAEGLSPKTTGGFDRYIL